MTIEEVAEIVLEDYPFDASEAFSKRQMEHSLGPQLSKEDHITWSEMMMDQKWTLDPNNTHEFWFVGGVYRNYLVEGE